MTAPTHTKPAKASRACGMPRAILCKACTLAGKQKAFRLEVQLSITLAARRFFLRPKLGENHAAGWQCAPGFDSGAAQ